MTARSAPQVVSSRSAKDRPRRRTAPMPNARPRRRGQAPKPQGLTAAIAVAAPSLAPSEGPKYGYDENDDRPAADIYAGCVLRGTANPEGPPQDGEGQWKRGTQERPAASSGRDAGPGGSIAKGLRGPRQARGVLPARRSTV